MVTLGKKESPEARRLRAGSDGFRMAAVKPLALLLENDLDDLDPAHSLRRANADRDQDAGVPDCHARDPLPENYVNSR
jgi:hypothetical protein